MNAKRTATRTIQAILILAVLKTSPVFAQELISSSTTPTLILASASTTTSSESAIARSLTSGPAESSSLPDAPLPADAMLADAMLNEPVMYDETTWTLPSAAPVLPTCPTVMTAETPACLVNPYHRFLDSTAPIPLTAGQKGFLAVHNFLDPGNIVTITGTAAFTVGMNSHTAYGPGFRGFLSNTKYSFSQDATGEFFGTFLIPALAHEDPHYHREPNAAIPRRIVHALSRTLIAQSDTGRMMPNYAVLMTYPISAEISNLYVPGIHGNGPSTVKRIATGLSTDPVNNLITEFLPDIARHINVRVIFVQRLVNMMTANNAAMGPAE